MCYWLRDAGGRLPKNGAKLPLMEQADPTLVAGGEYPLDLRFTAGPTGEAGGIDVRLDHDRLARLFDEQVLKVKIERAPTSTRQNMPAPR